MITFTPVALSNSTQQAGTQTDIQTVALAHGGYVSVWNNFFSGVNGVFFQRFDAQGNPVGAVTQFANTTGQPMRLADIETTADGRFSILTQGAVGVTGADARLFVQSFVGSSGAALPQLVVNVTTLGPVGTLSAQMLADPASATTLVVVAAVLDAGFASDLVRLTVSTSGTLLQAPVVTNDNVSIGGGGTSELVEGAAPGQEFVLNRDGSRIFGTNGLDISTINAGDIISLSPGTVVVLSGINANPNVALNMFTSTGSLEFGPTVAASSVQGFTSAGAQTFAKELVDLGDGRLLIVFVSDGGDTVVNNGQVDGVYAQVYNINTGSIEGNATLIRNMGQGNNDAVLNNIRISADLMADGRVALGLSVFNGLGGEDVFSTVLDARVAGIAVSATTATDLFVGTGFDDVFTGVSGLDTIIGGLGSDSVIFSGGTARAIDLEVPGAFPLSEIVLNGIENVTGGNGADDLRGSTVANALSGGAGNDTLLGRGGSDVLDGAAGDDLLRGDAQSDTLSGGTENDQVFGGADNDLLAGGAGTDMLRGDIGDDTINGDADNDRLFGGDGDDLLSGGDGDDIVTGGAGTDALFGGIGNDTLLAEAGADLVFGGTGNDVIRAVTDVLQVDGGTGVDTVVIANVAFTPGTGGAHLDLTGDVNLLGQVDDYTRMLADITGIENVTGSAGDDFIAGNALANVLRGGNGDDILFARGGSDTLFGNAGADSFVFASTADGADLIGDFGAGLDQIALVLGAFGDINAGNLAARLTLSATGVVAANATAQLTFDNSGAGAGRLSFDADGNGAGVAVLLATLTFATDTGLAGFGVAAFDFL